ncbi:MAG: tol-pal system protein YbgF [Azospirillaceae bacterium]
MAGAVLIGAAGLAVPAAAAPNVSTGSALADLDARIATATRALEEGERAVAELQLVQSRIPDGYAAQVEVRLTQLERRLQELTGEIERLGFRQRQLESRIDRAISDIEFRLDALEGGGGGGAPSGERTTQGSTGGSGGGSGGGTLSIPDTGTTVGSAAGGAAGGASTTASDALTPPDTGGGSGGASRVSLPGGDVAAQYDYAFGLVQHADYARAQQALQQFVDQNADHPLASNAQFWLGETYYVRGRFNEAATAFARGYQRFPDGAKAVDSLMKLGMSLAAMGQTQDACLTYTRLEQEFPDAPTAVRRRVDQEQDRQQCN